MQKYGLLGIEAIFRIVVLNIKIVFRISTGTCTLIKDSFVWCFMHSGKDHIHARKTGEIFAMENSFKLPANALNHNLVILYSAMLMFIAYHM